MSQAPVGIGAQRSSVAALSTPIRKLHTTYDMGRKTRSCVFPMLELQRSNFPQTKI